MTIARCMVRKVEQDSPKGEIGTIKIHPILAAALRELREKTGGLGLKTRRRP